MRAVRPSGGGGVRGRAGRVADAAGRPSGGRAERCPDRRAVAAARRAAGPFRPGGGRGRGPGCGRSHRPGRGVARPVGGGPGPGGVGDQDDLFACGGDSLAVVRIAARIAERFGVDVPASAFFESPTPAGFGAVLARLTEEQQHV
ncbi:acyl carrier protein [Kitasatospora saccharophila]|uniref:acyl carrier protein n=1 Tax=Kitasatospora saccharophila TaxID=407973 RepID=UPI0036293410